MHNAKFDLEILRANSYPTLTMPPVADTMVMAHLLGHERLSLSYLAFADLGITIPSFSDLKVDSVWELSPQELEKYNLSHTQATQDLCELYEPRIEEGDLGRINTLEHQLIPVVVEMELRGIQLDKVRLKKHYSELVKEIKTLEKKIYFLSGVEFNINSSQQLAETLTKNGIPLTDFTETGKLSVNKNILKKYAKHPLISTVLEYKKKVKLLNTFVEPYLEKGDTVFANFNQCGTVTGRFSSSNPNLQNIPPEVRGVFIPRKGHKFIIADYNQIELRILADFAREDKLLQAFKNGEDIHSKTAKDILGDEKKRHEGKTINFAIFYGIQAEALAQQLDQPVVVARAILKRIEYGYPKIAKWKKEQVEKAKAGESLRSLFGRKYSFPYGIVTAHGARQAVNYVVQGSAADVCKEAMVTVFQRTGIAPVIQVHDELVYEIEDKKLNEFVKELETSMPSNLAAAELPVDIEVVSRWK